MKPPKKLTRLLPCVLGLVCLGPAFAEEEPASASDTKSEPVTVNGVFEPLKSAEITADSEQAESLEIQKIVAHGSQVQKGQNLVWFETEAVDQQIDKADAELRLAELDLREAEFAHEQFLETQKLDRAAADRTFKQARQEYDNFVQVDREQQIKSADYSLTNAKASLENAMEELKQLEQMYKEDDLTEESEEIVLKRAKQSVENAEFRFRTTEISTDRALKQTIPRTQAEQEAKLSRAELAHEKALRDLDASRTRREIELRQKRVQVEQQREDFEELKQERKALVIRAPAAGIVVHGKLTRGRVSDKPSSLTAGSTVTGKQVLMTLFEPGPMQIRLDVEQQQLAAAKVGAEGKVTVAAYPGLELKGRVKSISLVPFAGTKFDGVAAVKLPRDVPSITPGMTCQIEFAEAVEAGKPAGEDQAEQPAAKSKKKDDDKQGDRGEDNKQD